MARRPRDPFSAHEAMDRTHLVATVFHDFIVEHPFIQSNAKLRREVESVANPLGLRFKPTAEPWAF